jgi:drug/metabolite transporter (DMT)-like permease
MNATSRALLQMHLCVLIWGFTPILGKLITLPALSLVWWRMALVSVSLLLFPQVWRGLRHISREVALAYAGVGVLVAIHWLAFYASIKLSNASVAATCLAITPVFTAFVEPWFDGRSPRRRDIGLALLAVPGVVLVVGGIPNAMYSGIVVGAFSSFIVSIFGTWNKRLAGRTDALTAATVQIGAGAGFLSIATLASGQASFLTTWPSATDFGWLLALAWGCTLVPYTLSLVALRHLSAFTAQLSVNLEPIYAMALAALLFGEQREVGAAFYAGAALVLLAVFFEPLRGLFRTSVAPAVEQPDVGGLDGVNRQ